MMVDGLCLRFLVYGSEFMVDGLGLMVDGL
jgi:hypothetical protein